MPDLDQRLRSFDGIRAPELWERIERHRPGPEAPEPTRSLALRVGVAFLALLVAAVGLAAITRGFLHPDTRPASPSPVPRITATIHLDAHPADVVAARGVIWVSNGDDGSLTPIDPTTNRPGPAVLCSMGSPLVADGALWTVGNNGNLCLPGGARAAQMLFRLDPATGAVQAETTLQTDPRLYATKVAAGAGALWAASWGEPGTGDHGRFRGVLSRVDPSSGRVTARRRIGIWMGGLAAGFGGVWVADAPGHRPGTLLRIDPGTLAVVARIPVGIGPVDVTTGYGSVWVANDADGTLMRIDPTSNTVVASIRVPGVGALAVGQGGIWCTSFAGLVTLIDPATNQVAGTPLRIGRKLELTGITVGDGAVWVTRAVWEMNASDQTVTRIALSTSTSPAP